jgi:hypothetical protein
MNTCVLYSSVGLVGKQRLAVPRLDFPYLALSVSLTHWLTPIGFSLFGFTLWVNIPACPIGLFGFILFGLLRLALNTYKSF